MVGSDEYTVMIARYGERRTVRGNVFLNDALYEQADAPIGTERFVWPTMPATHGVTINTGEGRIQSARVPAERLRAGDTVWEGRT